MPVAINRLERIEDLVKMLASQLPETPVMTTEIRVYGSDWCRFTFRIREYLMQLRVEYQYFDIDRDPRANEFVRTMNDGQRRYPVVVVGEDIVTNPTFAELRKILDANRVESRSGPRGNTPQSADREESRPA
jgi:mycoredoxin